jgi:hypothetical protein
VPVSPFVTVVACHIRFPLRIHGRLVYRLITQAGDDFVSASSPEIFDPTGAPTALAAELAVGSVVRVETSARGAMTAVQLVKPLYVNPFAR